jgi:hypothetical protein
MKHIHIWIKINWKKLFAFIILSLYYTYVQLHMHVKHKHKSAYSHVIFQNISKI